MNKYGALAQRHWKEHQPNQYHQLESPETFFASLGEQIADQVQTLTTELEARERDQLNQMDYLPRVGRLNAIRRQAEEIVFADLIWPQEQIEEPAPSEDQETRLARLGAIEDEDGGVMPQNPEHPLWALWETACRDGSTQTEKETFNQAYRTWLRENPDLIDD